MKLFLNLNFKMPLCITPRLGSWMLVLGTLVAGCGKQSEQQDLETRVRFSSFPYLVQTLYYLHGQDTNQELSTQIEDFINKEIVRYGSEVRFSRLSSQDQFILRVVKGYWETYPPAHRQYPATERDWKFAQAYLEEADAIKNGNVSQIPLSPTRQVTTDRVVVSHGFVPRMIILQCADGVTGKSITNCAVEVDGPVQFVSLYPNVSNPSKLDCRVVLFGQPTTNTAPILASAGVTNLDRYLTVQVRVLADHYAPETVRIPAIDLMGSNVVQRDVRLSPK